MKYLFSFLYILSIFSCTEHEAKPATENTDTAALISTPAAKDSIQIRPDSIPVSGSFNSHDSFLLKTAEEILSLIKVRDFKKLSAYVHPRKGVRFSAFAYVDTTASSILTAAQLANPATLLKMVDWGSFETGDTSNYMSIRNYFTKFVYDADFLTAKQKSVNSFQNRGTDINNIKKAFPGTDIVEFHFPGFDPKYEGMDYRTLRIVFETENRKPFLTGIVHDQWTP